MAIEGSEGFSSGSLLLINEAFIIRQLVNESFGHHHPSKVFHNDLSYIIQMVSALTLFLSLFSNKKWLKWDLNKLHVKIWDKDRKTNNWKTKHTLPQSSLWLKTDVKVNDNFKSNLFSQLSRTKMSMTWCVGPITIFSCMYFGTHLSLLGYFLDSASL